METNSNVGSNSRRRARYRHLILTIRSFFGATLVAATISGFAGCGLMNESPTAAPASPLPQTPVPPQHPPRPTPVKKSAVRMPRLEAALIKAVGSRLKTWKASIEARDLEKHLQHYADQIETYYLASNVNRDFVRADRNRAFQEFDTFKLEFINVNVNLEANDAAIITFDKGWNFEKEGNFSTGLVQQEIKMRKIDKQWLIVSERDLQVYRAHNQ